MKPTVKDVARAAGVSTATVSNVITDRKNVSDHLKKAVAQAMNDLDFIPNQAARSLRTNRSLSLGVLVPDIMNPFFGGIINSAAQFANDKGYRLILGNCNNDVAKETRALETLLNAGADGIIYVAPRVAELEINVPLKVPRVIVDRTRFSTDENIGFVYSDNYRGGFLAAQRLWQRGFGKYICIAGIEKAASNASQRVAGFRDFLREKRVPEAAVEVYNCAFTFEFEAVHKLVLRLLEQGSIFAGSAIFICSDLGAWGAIEALKSSGLSIPDDVAVVGYDNIIWSSWFTPRLTTIENPQQLLGEASAEMLITAIEKEEPLDGRFRLLDVTLIERSSV